MRTFFNAVTKASFANVGQLVKWIERYTNLLFPENGVEYWSNNQYGDKNRLKESSKLPSCNTEDDGIHHVACYVRMGGCEGRIIEISFVLRNGNVINLTWAKTFGNDEECWQIARALSHAMESIFTWEETPELVEMASKLPKATWWERKSSFTGVVEIQATTTSLLVKAGDQILDQRDFSDKGEAAHFFVVPRVLDWQRVCIQLGVQHKVSNDQDVEAPGSAYRAYRFSNRGIGGLSGVYYLKPGMNPLSDSSWSMYFDTMDKALDSVRQRLAQESVSRLLAA